MPAKNFNPLRVAFLSTALVTVVAAGMTLLLPTPGTWTQPEALFHVQLFIAVFLPALHILAAIFILRGLQGFKPELHGSYRLVAYGIILVGFSLVQSPLVSLFDLWDSWWLASGLITLPYIVAMAIIYVGSRTFYRALPVRSIWRSFWPGAAVVMAAVLVTVVAPHRPQQIDELLFDAGQGMFALTASFSLIVALTLGAVIRYVSPAYGRVLKWLVAGICIEVLLISSSIPARLLALDVQDSFGALQNLLLFAGIPYFVASYLFYQLTADTRQVLRQQNATAVEVVQYIASLASSPQYIQPLMEDAHAIATRRQSGQVLSEQDQLKLANTYLKLESYLTQWERLRTFTPDQLRSLAYEKFQNPAISKSFWQTILLAPKP
ncbi:MAG: hypothetical protein ACREGD_04110 [Candidatus Saccharimonadales bacterium]